METLSYFSYSVVGTVGLLAVLAAILPSGTHPGHALLRLGRCKRRTDTRTTRVFRLVRRPTEPVVFDFSRGDPRSVDVTIPKHSKWRNLPTFHLHDSNCMTLLTLDGWSFLVQWSIYRGGGATRADGGFEKPQHRLEYLQWSATGSLMPDSFSTVRLFTDAQLWRTECSIIQDAELYFSLCTTPLWVRALYASARWVPGKTGAALRTAMVDAALYVQLRAVYYKNDCWTDQGHISIHWYWWEAPRWVWRFQGQTTTIISKIVLSACYWVGWLLLGMKASYEEYNIPGEESIPMGEEEEMSAVEAQVQEK